MKIEKVSVTYGVKRSRNYQSVDVSMTTDISVAEGETMQDAFKLAVERMVPLVETEANAAIIEVCRAADL